MKKKWISGRYFSRCRRDKIYLIMKQMLFLLFVLNVSVFADVRAQRIPSFTVKDANLKNCIMKVKELTGVGFLYNGRELEQVKGINLSLQNVDVREVLEKLLSGTDYTYRLNDGVITIMKTLSPQTDSWQLRRITGVVKDKDGNTLPGVSVIVGGTSFGVATDADGKFKLELPGKDNIVLVFSYVGMKRQEVTWKGQQLVVVMQEEGNMLDETVVTGYFERNKNTFTGAAKTITGDEILKVSKTNLLNSLSILEPSVKITTNNLDGSNPNKLPELIIRGTSSLNTKNEVGINSPLIVIDGVESNLRALYDMDIFDIESVTVLKDAAATALYGEQAANGVILVTRKRSYQKNVRLSYNFTGDIQFPDLRDYNLMNAKEKLAFEFGSDLYDVNNRAKYQSYLDKLANVNSGVNTDWIAKPLRNAFTHNHNMSLSGEGSGLSYQLTARYSSKDGVMKADNRRNVGLGIYLSYNLKSKLIATIRADYSQTKSEDSKYGNFSDYVDANPYDAPYDEEGNFNKTLSYSLMNPLYESTLSSFSNSKQNNLTASLNLRWNLMKGMYITGFGSLTSADLRNDHYTSPEAGKYETRNTPLDERGEYTLSSSTNNNYLVKLAGNFNRNLDDKGSMVSLNAGGEVRGNKYLPYGFTAVGFLADRFSDPSFASGFPEGSTPRSTDNNESVSVAFISAGNVTYRSRYFVEGSYRLSGSSMFGKNERYAPFWSVGLGWNLHKESFADHITWINILRLRGSYGYTGSMNFQPYQAVTTYRYSSSLTYLAGVGAVPKAMGNGDLKWQTTKNLNFGLTSTILKNRLDVNIDWYKTRTVNMIVPVSLPPSIGASTVYANIGEQQNKGFEVSLSGVVMERANLNWRVNVNIAHNSNRLVKVGDYLKQLSAQRGTTDIPGSGPMDMYIEGESTTMLYAVRSAGIDPASGREIFINKDEVLTFEYNVADKVALGDREPKCRGALSSFFYWKGLSLNISAQYSLGGYIFNYSRMQRIEQVRSGKYNADKRAYVQRWMKPGDLVYYPSLKETKSDQHSARFVEKENYLNLSYISLGYEFEKDWLNNVGLKRLSLSISMNDVARFSTVRQERGINYPFARGFSFTISPTF